MYLSEEQQDLLDAVSENNTRRVNTLLKKGVDPNFEGNYSGSPLVEAIRNGNLHMMKALVAAGADVNFGGSHWDKPLDVADREGNAKIIEWLEGQGAKSAEPDRLTHKQRQLMDAISDGDTRKVQSLLDKGLDPDFADSSEATPLDEAIRSNSATMVRALVEAGADVNRVNSFKEAPLDVAKSEGFTAIAQYLETEGAISGNVKKKGAAKGAKFSAKKARGTSAGMQDDDFWDDDKYFFGADDDRGVKKGVAKPHIKPKPGAPMTNSRATMAGGAESAPPKPVKPVFREDTLKDIFNPQAWVGKTQEMEELWNDVPKRLHKHFDFAAALAEARRGTLKQNAPKQRIALQPNLKPQAPQPESTNAQDTNKPPCPDLVPPAQPPKPPGPA